MLKVSVCHEYYCGSCDDIELPDLDPLCDIDQKRPVNSSIRDPNTGDVIEEG